MTMLSVIIDDICGLSVIVKFNSVDFVYLFLHNNLNMKKVFLSTSLITRVLKTINLLLKDDLL